MSGSTPPFFIERFQLPNGAAMSGGKLYFFVAGSTTVPKNVYSDYGLTIPLTQPLVLDAAGNAPQYFMESGLYKILLKDATNVLQYTRDQIEGATTGGGTSALFQDSDSIHWTTITSGGLTYNVGTVQTAAILDHKVLTDATTGDVPAYLVAKFVDADGNPLTVNGAHQLILPFARLDGAEFTGSVIVDGQFSSHGDTALATGVGATVHLVGPATIEQAIANLLTLPGITPGQWLMLNGSGQVVGVAAPSSDHKVLYDVSDAIPGFLGGKVQAGSGININVTTDGTNGKVMHLNVQAGYFQRTIQKTIITTPIALGTAPATDITGDVYAGGFQGNGFTHVQPLAANTLVVGSSFRYNISCGQVSSSTGTEIEMRLNGAQVPGTVANFASTAVEFHQEVKMLITAIGPSGTMITEQSAYGINSSGAIVSASITQSIDSIDTTQPSYFSYWANGASGTSTIGKISTTLEAI